MNEYRQMMKKVRKIEQDHTSLELYAAHLTNLDDFHIMKMKDAYVSFKPQMREVYEDLKELELADLWDESLKVENCDGELF